MLADTLRFLLQNLSDFFVLNLLLRFYLQVVRAPFSHPLAQFVLAITNFAVVPTRKLVPAVGGYDTATLLLAWLVSLLTNVVLFLIHPLPFDLSHPNSVLALALLSVLGLMRLSMYLLFGALLVQVIMSWVNPYNPLTPLLDKLTRPFLRPIQKALPPIANIDLSPMILILLIQLILGVVFGHLEQAIVGQVRLGA